MTLTKFYKTKKETEMSKQEKQELAKAVKKLASSPQFQVAGTVAGFIALVWISNKMSKKMLSESITLGINNSKIH